MSHLGALLAMGPGVAYRHNVAPLQKGGFVLRWDGTELVTMSLPGVDFDIFPNPKGIEDKPGQNSISEYFDYLEDKVEANTYAAGNYCDLTMLMENIRTIPGQVNSLMRHDFRLRNVIIDPIRVVESVWKMWCESKDDHGFVPGLKANHYDDNIYEFICPADLDKGSDDDIFIRSVLHVAHSLSRDLELARIYNVRHISFEQFCTRKYYRSDELLSLFGNRIAYPNNFAETGFNYRDRSVGYLCGFRKIVRNFLGDGRRDLSRWGEESYQRMEPWKREIIDFLFTTYGIFRRFEPLGYDFSYVGVSTAFDPHRFDGQVSTPASHWLVPDPVLLELLDRSSPERTRAVAAPVNAGM